MPADPAKKFKPDPEATDYLEDYVAAAAAQLREDTEPAEAPFEPYEPTGASS